MYGSLTSEFLIKQIASDSDYGNVFDSCQNCNIGYVCDIIDLCDVDIVLITVGMEVAVEDYYFFFTLKLDVSILQKTYSIGIFDSCVTRRFNGKRFRR